jgi:hypothetical protein
MSELSSSNEKKLQARVATQNAFRNPEESLLGVDFRSSGDRRLFRIEQL